MAAELQVRAHNTDQIRHAQESQFIQNDSCCPAVGVLHGTGAWLHRTSSRRYGGYKHRRCPGISPRVFGTPSSRSKGADWNANAEYLLYRDRQLYDNDSFAHKGGYNIFKLMPKGEASFGTGCYRIVFRNTDDNA